MKINIHHKITLLYGLIGGIVLLGVYFYLNNNLQFLTYQRIRKNLAKQVSLSKLFVEEQTFSLRTRGYDYDSLADKISKKLDLRVTVISPEGTVLGDSELDGKALREVENHLYRPEVQQALKQNVGESRRFSMTIKKDLLYMAIVFGKEKKEGVIRLAMPLEEIDLVSARLKHLLMIVLVVAFLFSLIIGSLSSILISKPIQEMSLIAKNIARGNFSQHTFSRGQDEIGDLARALNDMADQIKDRINETAQEKSRLEAVLLSMFEGVMVVDGHRNILLMNERLRDFLAVPDNPIGRKPLEVIRNIEVHDILDETFKLKKGVFSKEISVFLPEEKILLVHATPVLRAERIEGVVLVFHDITDLRKLERVRKDFVANVSHELRTPVTSIKGYAETLLEGGLEDKKNAEEFLKIISADSTRLSRLINDLLELSRIESSKMTMNLKPSSIRLIIDRVIKGLHREIEEKSITTAIDIPSDLPQVMIDEARMEQVFFNLIDNAIKYNNNNGRITFSAKTVGENLEVSVSDTGIGISEEDTTRIFERFYRVDKARSREMGGTGLGLSIVKHIIQAHHGNISLESVPDKGSTFRLTIPLA